VDFGALFQVLRRQWIVLVLALLLTAGCTYAMAKDGPNEYQSIVQMTMLNGPKINATAGIDGNPYLGYNQTLSIDVDLLTRNLTSPDALGDLKALGVTGSVTAEIAPNATGPFMELEVTGKTRAQATREMNVLITFSKQRWQQLQQQANAPADSIVTLQLIAAPGAPTLAKKQKFELTGGVAILGLVLSLLLAAAVDAVRRRRSAPVPRHRPRLSHAGTGIREDATDVFPAFSDEDWPASPGELPGPAEPEEVVEPMSEAAPSRGAKADNGAAETAKDTGRVASAAQTK
jgi:hypothetical protein